MRAIEPQDILDRLLRVHRHWFNTPSISLHGDTPGFIDMRVQISASDPTLVASWKVYVRNEQAKTYLQWAAEYAVEHNKELLDLILFD